MKPEAAQRIQETFCRELAPSVVSTVDEIVFRRNVDLGDRDYESIARGFVPFPLAGKIGELRHAVLLGLLREATRHAYARRVVIETAAHLFYESAGISTLDHYLSASLGRLPTEYEYHYAQRFLDTLA